MSRDLEFGVCGFASPLEPGSVQIMDDSIAKPYLMCPELSIMCTGLQLETDSGSILKYI